MEISIDDQIKAVRASAKDLGREMRQLSEKGNLTCGLSDELAAQLKGLDATVTTLRALRDLHTAKTALGL